MNDGGKNRIAIALSLWSVLADTLVIAFGYLLYTRAPYFSQGVSERVLGFFPVMALCLVVCSLFSCLFEVFYNHTGYRSKSYVAFVYVYAKFKLLLNVNTSTAGDIEQSKTDKHALFIVLVKVFYIPLMLQFAVNNFLFLNNYILSGNHDLTGSFLYVFSYTIYPFIIGACFFVDTIFFLFGYLIYSDALDNNIRSVETTFLGWAVALLCYPPINTITANFIPALYHDHPETGNNLLTFILRFGMIALLLIYTIASVNLGWKCSNLTNRGIVSHGVYSFVRHPAYISKNLFWWFSLLPIIIDKPVAVLYMSGWSFLYFLRAITEERHLLHDPDYVNYCEQVPYRFIPKIY